MKRNWDTIREILTKLEDSSSVNSILQLSDFPSNKVAEIDYHAKLLLEAGLVTGEVNESIVVKDNIGFYITGLTWTGHEFLDSINNDTVWEKTKKSFISGGIPMTFELIKSVATDAAISIIKTS